MSFKDISVYNTRCYIYYTRSGTRIRKHAHEHT